MLRDQDQTYQDHKYNDHISTDGSKCGDCRNTDYASNGSTTGTILRTDPVIFCKSCTLCIAFCKKLCQSTADQKQNCGSCCFFICKHISLIGDQKCRHNKKYNGKNISHQSHYSHEYLADASSNISTKSDTAYHKNDRCCHQHQKYDFRLKAAGY